MLEYKVFKVVTVGAGNQSPQWAIKSVTEKVMEVVAHTLNGAISHMWEYIDDEPYHVNSNGQAISYMMKDRKGDTVHIITSEEIKAYIRSRKINNVIEGGDEVDEDEDE